MAHSTQASRDDAVAARWQHVLASRVIIQAIRDLRDRQGRLEHRASALAFLTGSTMLRYWCQVGGLDPCRIMTLARR